MKKILLVPVLVFCYSTSDFAQKGIVKTMYSTDSIITFRVYDTQQEKIEASQSLKILKELLKARNEDDLILQSALTDRQGSIHYFYAQYYSGTKVENGMYISHAKNNLIESVNGDFFKVGNVDVKAKLSEKDALTNALEAIGARTYKWHLKH